MTNLYLKRHIRVSLKRHICINKRHICVSPSHLETVYEVWGKHTYEYHIPNIIYDNHIWVSYTNTSYMIHIYDDSTKCIWVSNAGQAYDKISVQYMTIIWLYFFTHMCVRNFIIYEQDHMSVYHIAVTHIWESYTCISHVCITCVCHIPDNHMSVIIYM